MEQVTVSSKGQIAIPKQVREALNLAEGSKLTLEVRGQEIVLSKGDAWRELQGAARDLQVDLATFRKAERELEDKKWERELEDPRP
ncbi:MAG: AbrB/MazE/SpoVT family DNA-binding domain-containing protein [Candidatus Korobacteraceae bacterium]